MSSRTLTPVSYVVLGLIARDGASTAYDVKTAVAKGIAHFWPFPHSQIYSETEYLAGLGFLSAERERTGRRRQTFRVTDAGRKALASWLREPTAETLHIRSYAFLKLYFGYFARPEDVRNLAMAQIAAFETRLSEIGQMMGRLETRDDRRWQLALAEIFSSLSQAILDGWRRVETDAVRGDRALSGDAGRGGRRGLPSAVKGRRRRQA